MNCFTFLCLPIRPFMYLSLKWFAIIVLYSAYSCSDSNEDDRTNDDQRIEIPATDPDPDPVASSSPLFRNSIVSTNIDFIRNSDTDSFVALNYVGQSDKEMPDSRNDDLFDTNTYVFEATFTNGKKVGIWSHSSFGSKEAAQIYTERLTSRLGKLPEFMRDELSHVVVHKGDAGAFSDDRGRFMVLYSDNMDIRISNNDLEETVFHETVHASLDLAYARSSEWIAAQEADGNFITDYGKEFKTREDLAESALFSYIMITYPGRLSPEVENWVKTYTPNRHEFFKTIF